MRRKALFSLSRVGNIGVVLSVALFVGAVAPGAGAGVAGVPSTEKPNSLSGPVLDSYGRLPLYFIENRGQVDHGIKYYEKSACGGTWFTSEAVGLTFYERHEPAAATWNVSGPMSGKTLNKATSVRLLPVGLNPLARPAALEPRECRVSYFLGKDPKGWRRDIPTYGAIAYQEAYPGIDLKFYGKGNQLEYDVVVKPGADPNRVQFRLEGAQGLRVTKEGDLAITLPEGRQLLQKKPMIYQEIDGARVLRDGNFRLHPETSSHIYGFEVSAYDRNHVLVIDPVVFLPTHLVYSTYLGGAGIDFGSGIALDNSGNAYIAGTTQSADFPHDPLSSFHGGGGDAFVAKLNASGSALLYSFFLGGLDYDESFAVKVDSSGCAYVAGTTHSADFPVHNAAQGVSGGGGDAFVVKVNALGNDLVYSTYLGGSSNDYGMDLALGQNDNAYVTGWTQSDDFPKQNPLQSYLWGLSDVFVTRINATGSAWVYSTYLGGSDHDSGHGIAVDLIGCAYVTGETHSTNFPHYAAQALKGQSDAFVTKIASNGSSVVFSTLLGGSSNETGWGIALDSYDWPVVTGQTWSNDFPTQYPVKTYGGSSDAFVTKLNGDGTALAFSTYLGGSDYDRGFGIAVGSDDSVYVTGEARSADFPLLNAAQSKIYQTVAAFVTKLNVAGSLRYSTFLGGALGYGIAVNQSGNAFVTGEAFDDFPVKNPLQTVAGGNGDGFVSKLIANPATLSGLLAFYPFEGNAKDICGGRDGTVYGANPAFGYEGQGYLFNGVTDYIQAPVNINPGRYPELTMGCWARASSGTPFRTVLSHDDGGYDRTLGIDNRGGGSGWSAFSGSGQVLGFDPVNTGAWTFLAVVYNQTSGTVTLYVDDKLFLEAGTLGQGNDFLRMGGHPWGVDFFSGIIDNVFVFNQALDADQIAFIRETGAGGILSGKSPAGAGMPPILHLLLD